MEKQQIKIGAVTIGQAPRTDITADILPLLPQEIQLVEYGALDDYSYEEVIAEFDPHPDDEVLVSRMRDGRQAKFTERFITPLVQKKIDQAEADGVSAVILFCTGVFPAFKHRGLFLEPQPLFHAVAEKLAGGKNRRARSRTGSGGTGIPHLGKKRREYPCSIGFTVYGCGKDRKGSRNVCRSGSCLYLYRLHGLFYGYETPDSENHRPSRTAAADAGGKNYM